MNTEELRKTDNREVVEGIQEVLSENCGYIEEFDDIANCAGLWSAYCDYMAGLEEADHYRKAVSLWLSGDLNEYLRDCPAGPRK